MKNISYRPRSNIVTLYTKFPPGPGIYNGLEDKLGEMDFKIAGTEKGICSLQLDVKNQGISDVILKKSLEKARQHRLYLLEKMKKHIFHPRSTLPTQVIKCRRFYVGNEKVG